MLWLHPFYVSVTEVVHNAADKSVEISVRIFTDDFEAALTNRFKGQKIDLFKPQVNPATDSLIATYLRENLQLTLNGAVKASPMQYLGFERQDESVWCYLEIANVPLLQKLAVQNRLLYEFKPEQINMIHTKAAGKEQSYKLNNPAYLASFTY